MEDQHPTKGPVLEHLLARSGWVWIKRKIGGLAVEVLEMGKPSTDTSAPKGESSINVRPSPAKVWDCLFRLVRLSEDPPFYIYQAVRSSLDTSPWLRAALGEDLSYGIPDKLEKIGGRLIKVSEALEEHCTLCGVDASNSFAPLVKNMRISDDGKDPPVTWRMWGEYGTMMACIAGGGWDCMPRICTEGKLNDKPHLAPLARLEGKILAGGETLDDSPSTVNAGYGILHLRWRHQLSLTRLEEHLLFVEVREAEWCRDWCAHLRRTYDPEDRLGQAAEWVAVWVRCVPGEGHGLEKNMSITLLEDIVWAVNTLNERCERRLGLLLFGDTASVTVGDLLKTDETHDGAKLTILEHIKALAAEVPVIDFRGIQAFNDLPKECWPPFIAGRFESVAVKELLQTCEEAQATPYLLTYNQMLFYRHLQRTAHLRCAVGPEAGNLDNFAYSGVPVISVDIRDPVEDLESSTIGDRIGQYSLISYRWTLLNGACASKDLREDFRRYLLGAILGYLV